MTVMGTPAELDRMAKALRLEVAVTRLLGHLFPGAAAVVERPGRHRVLEDVVEDNPALFQALLDDERKPVLRAWAASLRKRGSDVRFAHALAVLYRERALDEIARDNSSDSVLVFATTLWSLLLSTKAFWRRQSGRTPAEEAVLRDTVVRELLTLHVTIGSRKLAEGAVETARPHLSCLADCRAGAPALTRALKEFGLPYTLAANEQQSAEVSAIAENLLGGWCADVLRVARKAVDDPAAIAGLPEGIRRNYQGGIRHLEPFVRTGVPVARILRTGLEWYNEWCFSLYDRQEIAGIRKLLTSSAAFADQLIPLCGKGSGHLPENQALSQYYLFRGFAADGLEPALTAYRESLAWNPANANAQDLLDGREAELVETELDKVLDLIETKDFERARRILDALPSHGGNGTAVEYLQSAIQSRTNARSRPRVVHLDPVSRDVLVGAYLRHAVRAAGKNRFGAAAAGLRTALELDPAPEERPFVEQQLAAMLNAQGVELINETQQVEKKLISAVQMVTASVETRMRSFDDGFLDSALSPHSGSCAVCREKQRTNLGPSSWLPSDFGFTVVVSHVLLEVRSAGSFRVTDPVRFWKKYDQHLCQPCRNLVQSVAEQRNTASGVLREAARLDPRNKTIKKNIQVLEELGRRT